MKLSVVIPVYRVEKTLDRCVESVLRQRVDDMEVILVDDGSPDSCPQRCDQWAQQDKRITVIHQQNGGLSDARNAGIEQAQGDYITFVDSDDYLSPDTYGQLLEMMGDNDIVEYSIADRLQLEDHSYENTDDYWLKERVYLHTYACNKIYRRGLFDNVKFPKGRVFEDVYTLPQLLRKAHKVATTQRGYYHYTLNPEGITMTADGEELSQLLEGHLKGGMPMDDAYYMHLVNIQIDVWEQTHQPIALPYRKVDTTQFSKKNKIKAIILNLFGINNLCRIFKIKHYIKKPNRW